MTKTKVWPASVSYRRKTVTQQWINRVMKLNITSESSWMWWASSVIS
jgi:hypothetical protein